VSILPYTAKVPGLKFRLFLWESILDYLGIPDVTTMVLLRQKQGLQSQRRRCHKGNRDWNDVATSQEMLVASKSWKMQRTGSP
jgi:hypothetical protein